MFALRVLGTLSLDGPGNTAAVTILAHAKRTGLLAYLALARPRGFHRRDTLYALFWPESDLDRARSSLRQALHQVRRVLGNDAIVNRGDDDVGLAPGLLRCDALEFEKAVEEGRHADAHALYGGELLPGFYVPDAPGFEEWLEGERARLARLAQQAAWTTAEDHARLGDPAAAAAAARRAAAWQPHEEPAQRKLIELLDRLGDPAGALRAYDEFARRLRDELDTEPSEATAAIVKRIRERSPELPPPPAWAVPAPPPAPMRNRRRWSTRPAVLYTAGIFTVLSLAAAWKGGRVIADASRLDASRVTVVPFDAVNDTAALGETVAEMITMRLAGGSGPRAAESRVVAEGWRRISDPGRPTLEDQLALARRLGTARLLTGSLTFDGRLVVINAQLYDAADGALRVETQARGDRDSLISLIDAIAARAYASSADTTGFGLATAGTTSLPALRAYLEGRRLHRAGRYAEAIPKLRGALELDSTFAVAALWLADALRWAPDASTREAWQRAVDLRGRLTPPDRAYFEVILGEFPGIMRYVDMIPRAERAVGLARDRPEAWFELGDGYFHAAGLSGVAQAWERARTAFNTAIALDSSYLAPYTHLIQIEASRGDRARLQALASAYLARDSTGWNADFIQWRVAVALGDEVMLRHLRARFDRMNDLTLFRIASWGTAEVVGMDDVRRVLEVADARSGVAFSASASATLSYPWVRHALGRWEEWMSERRHAYLVWPTWAIMAAWIAGDTTLVRPALDFARTHRSGTNEPILLDAWWQAVHGRSFDTAAVRRFVARRPALEFTTILPSLITYHMLPAGTTRERRLAVLDSLFQPLLHGNEHVVLLARYQLMAGDSARALATLRARPFDTEPSLPFLAESLRDEGRLAAALGDTTGAIRAYRRYLLLREHPDARLRPMADSVRSELRSLAPN